MEGGIHGEELWGVEEPTGSGVSKQDEEAMRELQEKITDLEQQVDNYKKALEESIQEPEANKLMELVEQARSEREDLASKCKELEGKLSVDEQSKEELQAATEELGTRLKELELSNMELEKELSAKTQSEIDLLAQIKDLQDELTKTLEAYKEAEELKDKLHEDLETSEETQKDLEREKEAMQKQLNESFLQISALKVSRRHCSCVIVYHSFYFHVLTLKFSFPFRNSLTEPNTRMEQNATKPRHRYGCSETNAKRTIGKTKSPEHWRSSWTRSKRHLTRRTTN